jgi:F0F1-type ATP synthase assembly protein I
MPRTGKKDDVWAMVAKYTSIAFLLPSAVFVGYAIGFGLDKWFGTTYWKTICLIIGVISGFVELVRELMQDAKEQEKSESTRSRQ